MQSLPHLLWLQRLESIIDLSPLTVEPETPLSDVVSQMDQEGAAIVLVVNSQVLGWFCSKDVVKLVALGVDFQATKIAEVMNTSVMTFQLSQFPDLATIVSMLRQNQSSCLLIFDEQAQLMGTITSESIYPVLEAASELNSQKDQKTSQEHLRLLEPALVNANDAILTGEENLLRMADTTPVLIWMSGTDTLCNFFNKPWLEFTGNTLQQEISTDWAERLHSEDLQGFLDGYLSAFHHRQYFSMEYRLRRVDGQYRWLFNTGVPQFTSNGSFAGYMNSCIDINEYKQLFAVLEESTSRLKLALEATETIYWECNLSNDQIFFLNPVDVIGVNRELTHREVLTFFHPDDRAKVDTAAQEAIANCSCLEVEHRMLIPGQTSQYKWLLSRGTVITDITGKPTRLIGVSMDITKQVQAQTALEQVNQELERRVAERTLALQEANRQLQLEISDRQIAQEQLRQSQQMLQLVIDTIPQCVFWKDRNSVFLGCNRNFAKMLGFEHPGNIIGKTAHDFLPNQQDADLYRQSDLQVIETNTPEHHIIETFLKPDGQQVWLEKNKLPLHDPEGNVIGVLSTLADITERQQTEAALRHSEERFRNLVEASSDWVWEVNQDTIYTYVSPKVRDILGYEPQELLGKTPLEIMPPAEAERVMKIFAPILEAQQPFKCLENTNIHQDGRLVILETSGVPVFDREGKFSGYRGIDRDITARKQVEINLYHTQQQLQAILDNSPAIIYVMDIQSRFILINRRYEQLLKTTQAEIVGKSLYDVWPHEIANGFVANDRRVITDGMAIEVEETVPQEDGVQTYLSIKFPLKDHNGLTYAICGISTDITERKLAEDSLLRFHKAMESTSDAVIFSDILDTSIYINPAFQELYGYNLEQLQALGGVCTIFQEPEERQEILDTVMKGESWRGELTMRSRSSLSEGQSRDGRLLQVDLRSDAIKDSNGKIIGTVCIHTDITKRQQVEEGLRLRDRAIDASSNGIIIADASTPNGPIIYVNPAFERMTGYSAAEVIGQNFRLFQSADIDQPGLRELSAAMQTGKACTVVLRNYRKDGSLLWNELNISPVYDNAEQLTHYISIQTDITERKQAETALLISQQRLQYLLTSSPAVIYTCKTFGDFGTIFISDNITTITGYEAREFTENSGFWSSHIHPDDIALVFNKLSHILEQGNYKLEYRFLHKDGTYHWLYDKGRVVQDDATNPVEMVGYLIDITDRKQLEEYLKIALAKEKELSELKSRFVSMTSHEFRTPLSTILSSSELLEHYRHKWTEEKQLTHLHRIQAAVKRMTEMLNDILIIGKAEAGKLEFMPRSFDVVAYCRNLVEETQLNLSNKKLHFISEYESMLCWIDEKLLGHIISNLISNAIKYSPDNSHVQLKFYSQDECAVFEVQDWGIGIPAEDITHLFESFYRAKNVGNVLGTGLGLAIVKKCVDIHQGEISVSSISGVGTVFTVHLPLQYQI